MILLLGLGTETLGTLLLRSSYRYYIVLPFCRWADGKLDCYNYYVYVNVSLTFHLKSITRKKFLVLARIYIYPWNESLNIFDNFYIFMSFF